MNKLPITILLFFCANTYAGTHNTKGKVFTTDSGNEITMSAPVERPVNVVNQRVNKMVVTEKPKPVMLDGETIIDKYKVISQYKGQKVFVDEYYAIEKTIDSALVNELQQLEGGIYSIEVNNIVVNKQGKIIYFETEGIKGRTTKSTWHMAPGYYPIDATTAIAINNKIEKILAEAQLSPLVVDGKPAPYLTWYEFAFTTRKQPPLSQKN